MAEVIILPGEREAGELVADTILSLVARRREEGAGAVLGLATGSSPLPVYRALAERIARGDGRAVALREATAFALDEYVGLAASHPQSYRSVIAREVVEPLGLDPERVHVPSGDARDIRAASRNYEAAIATAGGVDLQLLGIGTDGHVGFNEPGSSLASRTRVKTLTAVTRRDNARFFDSPDDVPMHCITQGLGTILEARHLVLLAFGERKAEALAAAVEGPLTASLPGSVIQLHPHVTVVVDEAAAERLANADYYRYAYDNAPDWQEL